MLLERRRACSTPVSPERLSTVLRCFLNGWRVSTLVNRSAGFVFTECDVRRRDASSAQREAQARENAVENDEMDDERSVTVGAAIEGAAIATSDQARQDAAPDITLYGRVWGRDHIRSEGKFSTGNRRGDLHFCSISR